MAIVVKDLGFGYGNTLTIRDITFHVPEGRFTVLLGKNGSGKSTLMKLLAGLLPYRHGHIQVFEKEISSIHGAEKAGIIGYLPQFHSPAFPFTVEEVVLTGRASYVFSVPGRKDRDKTDEAIDRVGISRLRQRPYTDLSGGERQLVMIARVLAQESRVILLDEPLSHLDLSNQARLLALIRDMVRSGLTVMAVLHDPNVAFMAADDFILMKNGTIKTPEAGANPWDSATLTELYDTKIETLPFRERALAVPL